MYPHVRDDAGLTLLRSLVRREQLLPTPVLAVAGGPVVAPLAPLPTPVVLRTRTTAAARPRGGAAAGAGTGRAGAAGPAGTGSAGAGSVGAGATGSEAGTGSGWESPAGNPIMALVERAQDGDGEAFGQLYDHYADTVYRYIYYRVGGRATAEDLTSETFLRALRRIGTFTWQGRDFGAWLVTIARNLVADHFKSSRFRLEVTTGEMLDSNQVEPSPEESVLESLSNAALLEAVRRLNPQQQECVTLRFLQGLSVAETARIMGKNEGAIKTLQYRAVRTLARLLPSDAR